MQPFDYNRYLKNNPLLKESAEETGDKSKETNPMAKRKDIINKVIQALKGMQYDASYDATLQMIRANKKLEKGGTLVVWIGQSPEARLSAKNSLDVEITYIDVETTKKYFGLVKNQTKKAKDLSDSEGKDIDLGSTMDDIPMEQSVNKIVDIVKKAEQKVGSVKESFMGPDTDIYEEAQNILDDILSERDWMEIADMTFEDALDTVKAYGHFGPKARAIAEKLVALAQNS